MKKRARVLTAIGVAVVALGAVAAIVGPSIYRDHFAPPAAEAPSLSAEDSVFRGSDEVLLPEAVSGPWAVDDGSYVGYRVDEVLNGTPVTVTGRTSEVTGAVELDGLTLASATIEADVASITTDSSQRDRYFRETALRTADYPTASFRLSGAVELPEALLSGEAVEQRIAGELTIAGVTRPVEFTGQLRGDDSITRFAGQIPIVFADYGVTAPSLGFVSVEPEGFLEFEVVLTRG